MGLVNVLQYNTVQPKVNIRDSSTLAQFNNQFKSVVKPPLIMNKKPPKKTRRTNSYLALTKSFAAKKPRERSEPDASFKNMLRNNDKENADLPKMDFKIRKRQPKNSLPVQKRKYMRIKRKPKIKRSEISNLSRLMQPLKKEKIGNLDENLKDEIRKNLSIPRVSSKRSASTSLKDSISMDESSQQEKKMNKKIEKNSEVLGKKVKKDNTPLREIQENNGPNIRTKLAPITPKEVQKIVKMVPPSIPEEKSFPPSRKLTPQKGKVTPQSKKINPPDLNLIDSPQSIMKTPISKNMKLQMPKIVSFRKNELCRDSLDEDLEKNIKVHRFSIKNSRSNKKLIKESGLKPGLEIEDAVLKSPFEDLGTKIVELDSETVYHLKKYAEQENQGLENITGMVYTLQVEDDYDTGDRDTYEDLKHSNLNSISKSLGEVGGSESGMINNNGGDDTNREKNSKQEEGQPSGLEGQSPKKMITYSPPGKLLIIKRESARRFKKRTSKKRKGGIMDFFDRKLSPSSYGKRGEEGKSSSNNLLMSEIEKPKFNVRFHMEDNFRVRVPRDIKAIKLPTRSSARTLTPYKKRLDHSIVSFSSKNTISSSKNNIGERIEGGELNKFKSIEDEEDEYLQDIDVKQQKRHFLNQVIVLVKEYQQAKKFKNRDRQEYILIRY